MTVITSPGRVLGIVGGGQLGRMIGEAAAPLGVEVVVLDPTPDCPAFPVVRDQIVGGFDDADAVASLADRADVLTYEIELADPAVLESVSNEYAVEVHPNPSTLELIQDKYIQNEHLRSAGIPTPDYYPVDDVSDLERALESTGRPAMVKARRGGYDGRGTMPIDATTELETVIDSIGGPAVVERFVDFTRELSVVGARGRTGTQSFVVGENIHREEILRETVVPARTDPAIRERAQAVAATVLESLDGYGTFGIELFETESGEILVNEIAPRPHNSGHWTIEGAPTSQFEQHVRAVMGMPLGATEPISPTVSANILGDVAEPTSARLAGVDAVLAEPHAHLHWYGKREVRPLRKMGHLTVVGNDPDTDPATLLKTARTYRQRLHFES